MELVSIKEMCQLLGVSRTTLWAYEKSGKVPEPVRIGGRVKWRRADIEEWIKGRCPESKPQGS